MGFVAFHHPYPSHFLSRRFQQDPPCSPPLLIQVETSTLSPSSGPSFPGFRERTPHLSAPSDYGFCPLSPRGERD